MIDQQKLTNSLDKLIGWLETWCDDQGAYKGFVVHRTEAKRMGRVHDTAWTQSAMIRGYGNLYRKSREPRWGDAMIQAADLFASRYNSQTGRISYTGHEDDRFQSLVSCALGVCALLSVADLVNEKRRTRYVQIASEHARRYWIDVLWVEREGAFKFTEIDYWSPHEDRFVVNFNTMAAEALLAIHAATGENEFREFALRVGHWLIDRWNDTQTINKALLADHITVANDPASRWMAPGGFSYQFTETQRTPDNYVVLYNGLSLRGLMALYQASTDERYVDIIRAQSKYILAMRDPATRLFYHTAWQGRIEKKPQFIAGAGMILSGLHEVMPLISDQTIPEDTIISILNRSYPNGAYPGFLGMNDKGTPRRSGGGIVWEDVAASMNWNAQLFEYLTRLVENPSHIDAGAHRETVCIMTKRFFYFDSPTVVKIFAWWPPRSWGIYWYIKKKSTTWVAIYPVGFYGTARRMMKVMMNKLGFNTGY
jgi:hypothetical protein